MSIIGKIEILILSSLFLFVCVEIIEAVPFKSSLPIRNNSSISKNDFSTNYAKQILRLAKSAEINGNLNPKIDPCVDFYQYSCGNWHRNNPAQLLNSIMTDKFQAISKAFDRRLMNIISEPENNNTIGNKVKIFYRACEIARIDKTEYELSLQNVYEEFGKLPFLVGDEWNETSFNWWETIARIQHKYGKQILLAVDIMGDIKNKSESRVYMGPPNFDVVQGTRFVNIIQEVQIADELKDNFGIDKKMAKKIAKEIIDFERELSQCGTDSRLGINVQDLLDMQDIETLATNYADSFDVKRYLELILESKPPESIYLFDEKYLHNALEIIDKTPKHVIANFIFYKLLQEFFVIEQKDLSNWCLEKTKKIFGKFVDNWVYEYYRDIEAEQEIFKIFEDLRLSFRGSLRGNKLDWISNKTRELAIEKLDAMKIIINSYENENFTSDYDQLQLDPYHYVRNLQNVLILNSDKVKNKLFEINTTTPEDTEVLAFTPSYNILENNIKIPVGFLQPRHFWSDDYPKAIKFATLGYLIAHEIIHGFDDEGRKFGKDGTEYSWWDPKSTYEFEERRKCFQAQYHSYKYGGKALPESVSQSENIADNAGVKLAYAAYTRWLNEQLLNDPEIEEKETLPNLSFNNRQLFFISFAQVWCEDVQSLFKWTVASEDDHAPGMYRVIGSLSNFPDFSWVFKCNPDAAMDPHYKCFIY